MLRCNNAALAARCPAQGSVSDLARALSSARDSVRHCSSVMRAWSSPTRRFIFCCDGVLPLGWMIGECLGMFSDQEELTL